MLRKLYSLVSGACCADNPDSPQHQEVLLPGFLYSMIIKERLDECLNAMKSLINQDVRRNRAGDFADRKPYKIKTPVRLGSPRLVSTAKVFTNWMNKTNWDIGQKMSYFLATGNLVSPTGLDLQQTTGYTIVAEKLNYYRYLAHFRCIHRGAFFAELKTTTVRKLLPESWGTLWLLYPPGRLC